MANQVAYGFTEVAHLFGERVATVGVETVNDLITQSMAEHNRQFDAVMSALVERTTEFQRNFKNAVETRNQPLDEHGDPLTVRGGSHYTLAWPIYGSGNALGSTYEAGLRMTVEELNDAIVGIQKGDLRWNWDQIFAAIFQSADVPFNDVEHGPLTVKGLANGDGTLYQVMSGADVGAADNHYLAQAAAIDNSNNPLPTIFAELDEHPENGAGEVIVFVPTNQKAAIQNLATFHPVPDPRIQPGANTPTLVGTLGVDVPGELIGYDDSGCWIVWLRRLPSDYLVAFHTGGPAPLRMRESDLPELRGFYEGPATTASMTFPYSKRRWFRKAGYGAWNRVGALAYRIGNASYAVPANYARPMA